MPFPDAPFGRIMRGFVVAALFTTATACSFNGSGEDEPTPVPWSGELRYKPVDGAFCDLMRWDEIVSDIGMAMGDVDSASVSHDGMSRVRCESHNIEADHLDGAVAGMDLVIFDDPSEAFEYHEGVLEGATTRLDDPVVETPDGWWSHGTALERSWFRPNGQDYQNTVWYHVYHENLHVGFMLSARGADSGADVAELHGVVMALLDDVKGLLPCRSLVDPPIAECG